MSPDLLSCPFCVSDQAYFTYNYAYMFIECGSCRSKSTEYFCTNLDDTEVEEKLAAEAWNRRA